MRRSYPACGACSACPSVMRRRTCACCALAAFSSAPLWAGVRRRARSPRDDLGRLIGGGRIIDPRRRVAGLGRRRGRIDARWLALRIALGRWLRRWIALRCLGHRVALRRRIAGLGYLRRWIDARIAARLHLGSGIAALRIRRRGRPWRGVERLGRLRHQRARQRLPRAVGRERVQRSDRVRHDLAPCQPHAPCVAQLRAPRIRMTRRDPSDVGVGWNERCRLRRWRGGRCGIERRSPERGRASVNARWSHAPPQPDALNASIAAGRRLARTMLRNEPWTF
jgi:hypothetical protein